MGKLIDLTGQRFGRLTVLERCGTQRYETAVEPLWRCRCDCGREAVVIGSSIRHGKTRSCGCLRGKRYRDV